MQAAQGTGVANGPDAVADVVGHRVAVRTKGEDLIDDVALEVDAREVLAVGVAMQRDQAAVEELDLEGDRVLEMVDLDVDRAEAQQRLPPGSTIAVLYNPDVGGDSIGGEFARVLFHVDDLRGENRRRLWDGVRFGYGPVVVCFPLLWLFSRLYARLTARGYPEEPPRSFLASRLGPGAGTIYLVQSAFFLAAGVVLLAVMFVMT